MSDGELVRIEWRGRAALLIIDNAPLNLLNAAVRSGLLAAIRTAAASSPERIIITGAGRAFVAGADAREFDDAPIEPHLNDVLRVIARLSVPTIAAINGSALGGGLEIALACQCRIAAPSARLGLPEVTLGVVPGAGGTQRLPRIVGIPHALDMILHGTLLSARESHDIGLVDRVATDPVAAAFDIEPKYLATMLVADRRPAPAAHAHVVSVIAEDSARRARGQKAPVRALELVAGTAVWDLDVGMNREREAFLELRESEQAKALRHIFFAERAASSRSCYPRSDRAIERAIVVGGGNMGASIAYALARVSITVTLVEMDVQRATDARRRLSGLVEQGSTRGGLTEKEANNISSLINVVVGLDNLGAADIVIEAVFEDLAVKQSILAALGDILPSSTILATNTSYLDVDLLAESVAVPERFLGLHFFSPAHVMKLLEIVRGAKTAPETIGIGFALAKMLGKVPVVAGVCDGFIGNRILTRYRQIGDILLAQGATPSTIDAAMRGFGMAMGPYEAQDMSGLDIAYANRQRQLSDGRAHARTIPILECLVEEHGRLGRKSMAGWYDYDEMGRPRQSALVEDLIVTISAKEGIARQALSENEIIDQMVIAMIAEACLILEEGIASSAQDVDLVLVHGYGFPRWRGGLMYHADSLSPAYVAERITEFSSVDPLSWRVPSLITKLVRDGKSFAATGIFR
ncbi:MULTISPECIES: FAD-dependent oxidoreductase [unclassified Novosphingobium]|uniref:FAD-dependent oxidoreductase n=1 Tax=unclassified Novosphingobium TaxID=2644732 RepID=UPI0025E3DE8D|nr:MULTISPECIES: FAD-dependent oxidoreductase [unclassified Novosphingobium]HQV03514.1 3-hydroxyacyl-CoA dehydrogenase NAD-binding domain-containing protein [Novosphingobium sp.]